MRPPLSGSAPAAAVSGTPGDPLAPRLVPLATVLSVAPWRLDLHHDRPHALLLWITRGQGRVTINGARRGFGTHNALFLPPGALLALEAGAQCLGQMLILPQPDPGALPDEALHLRSRDARDQGELTGLLDAIQRELAGDRPYRDDAIAAQSRLIGVWLRRQAAVPGQLDAPANTAARRLVARFARRVVAHHGSPQTMADHAEALKVTPTHLTRVCRSMAGMTAADILTQRRLHAARAALTEGRVSARVVSESLGFASPAYFTRFMQQHTGKSPTALRGKGQKALDW